MKIKIDSEDRFTPKKTIGMSNMTIIVVGAIFS